MKWEIEELGNGLVDLRRERRIWRYDLTMDEAMEEIRELAGPGTQVEVVEPDGYTTTHTVR